MTERTLFFAGLGLSALLPLAAWWALSGRADDLALRNAQLADELAALEAVIGDDVDPQALAEALRQQLDAIEQLRGLEGDRAGLVAAVGAAVPATLWLESLEVGAAGFELVGGSEDPDAVALLFDELQQWPCLESPALGGVRRSQDGYRWSITAKTPAGAVPCSAAPIARDPFLSPAIQAARDAAARRAAMPALLRFEARDFDYVEQNGDVATVQDPLGDRHQVMAGSALGSGGGRVQQVLPTVIVVVEEELINAETGELRSDVITLDRVDPSQFREPIPRRVPAGR